MFRLQRCWCHFEGSRDCVIVFLNHLTYIFLSCAVYETIAWWTAQDQDNKQKLLQCFKFGKESRISPFLVTLTNCASLSDSVPKKWHQFRLESWSTCPKSSSYTWPLIWTEKTCWSWRRLADTWTQFCPVVPNSGRSCSESKRSQWATFLVNWNIGREATLIFCFTLLWTSPLTAFVKSISQH